MTPKTSYERNKKYLDKKKAENLDEFIKLKKQHNQKYYKKIKREDDLLNNIDNDDNNDDNDDNDLLDNDDDNDLLDNDLLDNDDDNDLLDNNDINDIIRIINDNIPAKFNDDNILPIKEFIHNGFTDFPIYFPLDKRIHKLNKSILQDTTIRNYLSTFKIVYKKFNIIDFTDFDEITILNLLTNKKYDYQHLKSLFHFIKINPYHIIQNISNSHLIIIYSIITRIRYFSNLVCIIYPYILNISINYDIKRLSKTMTSIIKIKYNRISFLKDNVLTILNDDNNFIITNHKNYDNIKFNKLIFALFMLFPVRRPCDYIRMLITNSIPSTEKNLKIQDRHNYYFNKTFYFNRTKNKKIQKYFIPTELDAIIQDYINQRNIDFSFTNYFLVDDFNNHITSLKFIIMNIFSNIYAVSYSAVELRRFYATYINKLVRDYKLDELQHRSICDMMNHKYEENKKYAYYI